jgi:hypothetical protein
MTNKKQGKAPRRSRAMLPGQEQIPGTKLTATLKGRIFETSVVVGTEGKPEVGGVRRTWGSFDGRDYGLDTLRMIVLAEREDSANPA